MEIRYNLNNLPSLSYPIGLTIGIFDGLHLGHRHLFKTMKDETKSHIVLTFSFSPKIFLKKEMKFSSIISLDYKIKLLKKEKFDLIIVLPFTNEIKQMGYDKFLKLIKKKTHFSHLFLGKDATIGKNEEGNNATLAEFAKENGFKFTALDLLEYKNLPITSSSIRTNILNGNIHQAKKMLGRDVKYFFSQMKKDNDHYYFFEHELCLPLSGIYQVKIKNENNIKKAYLEVDQKNQCMKVKKKYFKNDKMIFPLSIIFL